MSDVETMKLPLDNQYQTVLIPNDHWVPVAHNRLSKRCRILLGVSAVFGITMLLLALLLHTLLINGKSTSSTITTTTTITTTETTSTSTKPPSTTPNSSDPVMSKIFYELVNTVRRTTMGAYMRRTPCENRATCVDRSDENYKCLCSFSWQGRHCNERFQITFPHFNRQSYSELKLQMSTKHTDNQLLRIDLIFFHLDEGFQGCIHELSINERRLTFNNSEHNTILSTQNIDECVANPCRSDIATCRNETRYIPIRNNDANSYKSICDAYLSSTNTDCLISSIDRCATKSCYYDQQCINVYPDNYTCVCLNCSSDNPYIARFHANSYIKRSSLQPVEHTGKFSIELWFLSENPSDKNSDENFLISKKRDDDGQCYRVEIERFLPYSTYIYIGGFHRLCSYNEQYCHTYSGCLKNFFIDKYFLDLLNDEINQQYSLKQCQTTAG
ncbi:unnamed protein product [Adineta steineri]|uniref:EGF-like domain-containing protein n=1 Tax=Adineta steineri TaxID=433720 RepID=A0A813S1N0_9BILA|nr:unnamed protein product [Adineta steineri]